MTLIRRLALNISDAVVQYASPGCKDWAEGLLREGELIESDWSALGWALGSTRVLLDRREAPLGSLDDVPAAAHKFVSYRHIVAGIWIYLSGQVLRYGWQFSIAKNWLEHAGCSIVVLSSISIWIYTFIERRRLDALMSNDIEDYTLFYKAELERQYYPKWWIPIISVFFYGTGMILAQRGGVGANPVSSALLGLLLLAVVPLIVHTRRRNRRRLDRLEALLMERSGEISIERLR